MLKGFDNWKYESVQTFKSYFNKQFLSPKGGSQVLCAFNNNKKLAYVHIFINYI